MKLIAYYYYKFVHILLMLTFNFLFNSRTNPDMDKSGTRSRRKICIRVLLQENKTSIGMSNTKTPQEWCYKDINTCITSGDRECQFNPESNNLREHQLTYFCGSSPECKRTGSKVALQKGTS